MGNGTSSGEGRNQVRGLGRNLKIQQFMFSCCYLGLFILLVILCITFFGLNISKIPFGAWAIYKDACPIQKLIPIYLIVGGATTVLMGFFIYIKKKAEEKMIKMRTVFTVVVVIGLLFNLAWLICGSLWVFGNYWDVIDGCGGSKDCCDSSLIWFALAVTIFDCIFYTMIFVALFCVCGGICAMCCCKDRTLLGILVFLLLILIFSK